MINDALIFFKTKDTKILYFLGEHYTIKKYVALQK